MGITKNFFGDAEAGFVTISGKDGRVTPKDVAEKKRQEQNHDQAEQSEKEARKTWLTYQAKRLALGFDYDWLDKQFVHRGEIYRVIGVRVADDRAFVVCRVVSGDRFLKTGAEFVRQKMKNKS
jgi:hypothetical protein